MKRRGASSFPAGITAVTVLAGVLTVFLIRSGPPASLLRLSSRLRTGYETLFTPPETVPAPDPEAEAPVVLSVPGGEAAKVPPVKTETPPVSLLSAGVPALDDKAELSPDVSALLAEELSFPRPDGPQVLVIHTHGSEAYTPEGEDTYTASDPMRTEDITKNVVRVGEELQKTLESRSISVLHDVSLYDSPAYTGSYARTMDAISRYLAEYPTIQVVIDLHRDAVEREDGSYYAAVCELDGKKSSPVMLVVGTDANGLEHPGWRENLKLALHLQCAMDARYPGLSRPITLSPNRYNQHLTSGSLLAEIGYCGNTLQEALTAARAFGECLSDVLEEAG